MEQEPHDWSFGVNIKCVNRFSVFEPLESECATRRRRRWCASPSTSSTRTAGRPTYATRPTPAPTRTTHCTPSRANRPAGATPNSSGTSTRKTQKNDKETTTRFESKGSLLKERSAFWNALRRSRLLEQRRRWLARDTLTLVCRMEVALETVHTCGLGTSDPTEPRDSRRLDVLGRLFGDTRFTDVSFIVEGNVVHQPQHPSTSSIFTTPLEAVKNGSRHQYLFTTSSTPFFTRHAK